MRIDADAAFDKAADAGPLVAVQIGTATGRKGHAVAAHQQFAFRQRFKKGGQLFVCNHAWRIGGGAAVIAPCQFPSPARHPALHRALL